jgi:hypothetical protein
MTRAQQNRANIVASRTEEAIVSENLIPDTVNFAKILEETVREKTRKVSPLPEGTYLCVVAHYEFATFGENKSDCVDFILKPLEVIEVDPEQLDQAAEIIEIGKIEIRHRVFVTEFGSQECSQNSLWKLVKFLDQDLGVSAGTLSEAIANAVGKQVIVTIVHKKPEDGKRTFLMVVKTAAASNVVALKGPAS